MAKSDQPSMTGEPRWDGEFDHSRYIGIMFKALNWYNYTCTDTQLKKFLIEWAVVNSKEHVQRIREADDKQIDRTLAAVARMATRGFPVREHHREQIVQHIQNLGVKEKKAKAPRAPRETSEQWQPKIRQWVEDLWADVRYKIVPKEVVKRIATLSSTRKQAFAVENLLDLLKNLASQTPETEQLADRLKSTLANLRPNKVVSAEKQVAQVTLGESFEGYRSLPKDKIVGAKIVWLYNTKTQQVIRVVGDINTGLQVKGMTLQQIKSATGKRLRKPKEQLATFMAKREPDTHTWYNAVRATDRLVSGRLGPHIIFLRME